MKNRDAAVRAAFILALAAFCVHTTLTRRPPDRERAAASLLEGMTAAEKAGQLIMAGLPGAWVVPSIDGGAPRHDATVDMNDGTAALLDAVRPGGVILFRYNVLSREQLLALTRALQERVTPLSARGGRIPLFISADQEGGRVTRLCYAPQMPGAMALGAARDEELAYRVSRAAGEELRDAGLNWNFSPVVDVNLDGRNPVIGVRSFGDRPALTARLAAAALRGLGDAGVIASAKHFPGHGDTSVDSHLALPLVAHGMERLDRVELVPFRKAIAEGADSIMTAHIIYPALDDTTMKTLDRKDAPVPVTLSRRALTGFLKKKLGYNGLVITDAMEMKAIADNFGSGEAAVAAVRAGADMLICTGPVKEVHAALTAACREDPEMRARIDESVKKILLLKMRKGLLRLDGGEPGPSLRAALPPGAFHEGARRTAVERRFALEREAAERAVTLVKNDGVLPLSPKRGARVEIFAPWRALAVMTVKYVREAAARRGFRELDLRAHVYGEGGAFDGDVARSDLVILLTHSKVPEERAPGHPWRITARSVIAAARKSGKPLVAIACGVPYDLEYTADAPALMALYSGKSVYGCDCDEMDDANLRAGIMALFGLAEPRGKLPVDIRNKDGKALFEFGTGLGY